MGEGNCTYEEHDYPRKVGGGPGSRSNAVPITFPPSQTFPAWEPSAPRMPLCRGREEKCEPGPGNLQEGSFAEDAPEQRDASFRHKAGLLVSCGNPGLGRVRRSGLADAIAEGHFC